MKHLVHFVARLGVISALIITSHSTCFADVDNELKIKTAFIYQFSKFIEWPKSEHAEFSILILGEDHFKEPLRTLVEQGKLFNGKSLHIEHRASIDRIPHADLVLIDSADTAWVKGAIRALADRKCAIITNQPGFTATGATISFVPRPDNTIGFSINAKAASAQSLSVGSALLRLSISDTSTL